MKQSSKTKISASKKTNSPGLIILQWLTYALWGWTVLALIWLIATVITNFISDFDTSDTIPYAIASVAVLLPIAAICDWFYIKREPLKKFGAAMVVMVIHAVIFALCGIGALIVAVFSGVKITIATGDTTMMQVSLYTALIVAAVYAASFLRTLNPVKSRRSGYTYIGFMSIVAVTAIALGISGPLAQAQISKDDRLIAENLLILNSEIQNYTDNNKKLPQNLRELRLDNDAQQLIDRNLVHYKEVLPSTTTEKTADDYTKTFYYELCVTYKTKRGNAYNMSDYTNPDKNGYSEYLDTIYAHPKGDVCYKLRTTDRTSEKSVDIRR